MVQCPAAYLCVYVCDVSERPVYARVCVCVVSECPVYLCKLFINKAQHRSCHF